MKKVLLAVAFMVAAIIAGVVIELKTIPEPK